MLILRHSYQLHHQVHYFFLFPQPKPVESPSLSSQLVRPSLHPTPEALPMRSQPPNSFGKGVRYKGKRAYPTVPNQPSEASAYFMFEMAKTVLVKAGGSSSSSLFKQPSNSQNHRGPHRALQMCAFQIGLYGLGLHNCVSPNWLSRTYSSHVSWITNQVIEIGAPALSFLLDTWEGHLTPQEAASIADKASRGGDPNTVFHAARLALSCLPHAHALNPNEIQRAILQCKEQSPKMLESACLAIESAAKGGGSGGVYPEVLFQVAQCWYHLYELRSRNTSRNIRHDQHQPQLQIDGAANNHASVNPADRIDINPAAAGQIAPQHQIALPSAVFPVTSNAVVSTSSIVANGANQPIPISNFAPSANPGAFSASPSGSGGAHFVPNSHGAMPPPYPFRFNYIQSIPPQNVVHSQMHFQVRSLIFPRHRFFFYKKNHFFFLRDWLYLDLYFSVFWMNLYILYVKRFV